MPFTRSRWGAQNTSSVGTLAIKSVPFSALLEAPSQVASSARPTVRSVPLELVMWIWSRFQAFSWSRWRRPSATWAFQALTGSPVETRQTSKMSAHSFSIASSTGMPGNTFAAQDGAGTAATHHCTRSFIVYSCQGFRNLRRARLTRLILAASSPASASGSAAWIARVQQPSGSSA